jgi:hypothetical protein
MYVKDLEGAYRQWRTDPLDWPRTAISHHGLIYYDLAGSFGARFSSKCQMMIVSAVIYILEKLGIKSYCYIDDFASINPTKQGANLEYETTIALLDTLGLKVSKHKLIPPSTQITWLGIKFDSDNMTLSIAKARVIELVNLCDSFLDKKSITKPQLQSILGKLLSISYIVPTLRLFLNRLLTALRTKVDGQNNVSVGG